MLNSLCNATRSLGNLAFSGLRGECRALQPEDFKLEAVKEVRSQLADALKEYARAFDNFTRRETRELAATFSLILEGAPGTREKDQGYTKYIEKLRPVFALECGLHHTASWKDVVNEAASKFSYFIEYGRANNLSWQEILKNFNDSEFARRSVFLGQPPDSVDQGSLKRRIAKSELLVILVQLHTEIINSRTAEIIEQTERLKMGESAA